MDRTTLAAGRQAPAQRDGFVMAKRGDGDGDPRQVSFSLAVAGRNKLKAAMTHWMSAQQEFEAQGRPDPGRPACGAICCSHSSCPRNCRSGTGCGVVPPGNLNPFVRICAAYPPEPAAAFTVSAASIMHCRYLHMLKCNERDPKTPASRLDFLFVRCICTLRPLSAYAYIDKPINAQQRNMPHENGKD